MNLGDVSHIVADLVAVGCHHIVHRELALIQPVDLRQQSQRQESHAQQRPQSPKGLFSTRHGRHLIFQVKGSIPMAYPKPYRRLRLGRQIDFRQFGLFSRTRAMRKRLDFVGKD